MAAVLLFFFNIFLVPRNFSPEMGAVYTVHKKKNGYKSVVHGPVGIQGYDVGFGKVTVFCLQKVKKTSQYHFHYITKSVYLKLHNTV